MFLQIHYLTSYHATLLNRDDAGLAKRIPFGGADRLRVSSQCLKRHWREALVQRTDLPRGIRSRHFFDRVVKRRLIEERGLDPDLAHALVAELASSILRAAGEKDALDRDTLAMRQPVLFGAPEADYFVELVAEAARHGDLNGAKESIKEKVEAAKGNFRAMARQAGVDDPLAGIEGALFGRFVTSDILARVDAPVHVAHAFTVHELDTEVDFFTVVDDLAEEEETGAAHANDMELGSGIFYGYVAVDVPLLVSNLTGEEPQRWREADTTPARGVLEAFVPIVAQVSPGAKLGATAPYAWADCVVLEAGNAQPRSLANAFLEPVRLDGERPGDPIERAMGAMARYLEDLTGMYGDTGESRWVAATRPWPRESERAANLREALTTCLESIFGEGDASTRPAP